MLYSSGNFLGELSYFLSFRAVFLTLRAIFSEKIREVLRTFVKIFTMHALSENYIT